MTVAIRIGRAGPMTTLQDAGRPGLLRHGLSASGPMDAAAFARAGDRLGNAGSTGIECSASGLEFSVEAGALGLATDGGGFALTVNGAEKRWPARVPLKAGDHVAVTPGASGNYGYLRFDREIDVPEVLGSRSTNVIARLGGMAGRGLVAGDRLAFGPALPRKAAQPPGAADAAMGPIRVIWGLHADLFPPAMRERFVTEQFMVTPALDRMGVRLDDGTGVFAGLNLLSLVSDAVVPGDIQILGDGTPIVLMRDHQPTGGYPRIATIVSADLDRFAQVRPGSRVRFSPVRVTSVQGTR